MTSSPDCLFCAIVAGDIPSTRLYADEFTYAFADTNPQAPVHALVHAPPDLPPLPAATEVVAYRIATEALTNAVRHSDATTVIVRLCCGDTLTVEVTDDGSPTGDWAPGVGLTGMRERAAELGGHCEVGSSPHGGRVLAALPVGSA